MTKVLRTGLWLMFVLTTTLAVMEISYRNYVFDFYKTEFAALNEGLDFSNKQRQKVVFFGDSFTANHQSYVSRLRDDFDADLINAAVSGTGALEMSFLAPKRISDWNPDVAVYQIYVGNDMIDVRHRPTGKVSLLRKVYHLVSDRIRVFKLLNYRFGQFFAIPNNQLRVNLQTEQASFSIDGYTERQKLLFKEEPKLIENSIAFKNGRDKDYEIISSKIHRLRQQLNGKTELLIVIVPHCAQVSELYDKRMRQLGSTSNLDIENRLVQSLKSDFSELKVIDLLPSFQQAELQGKNLYFSTDPHLSPNGQQFVAEQLQPVLSSLLGNSNKD